jgi:cytochrome c oxidase subunit I+III
VTGKLREVIHLPGNSWLPFLAALSLAVFFVSLLVRAYGVALFGLVGAAVFLLRWSWENGAHPKMAPVSADDPTDPPLHSRTANGPGLWGMVVTLMADGTFYLSLLFGWLYLWTVAPQWVFPEDPRLPLLGMLVSGGLLAAATFLHHRTVQRLTHGNAAGLSARLWLVAGLGAAHFALLLWLTLEAPLEATGNSHDAVLLVLLIYLLFHGGLSVLLTAMQALRVTRGYVSAQLPYEPVVLRPLWIYTAGVFWLSVTSFLLLPAGWSP